MTTQTAPTRTVVHRPAGTGPATWAMGSLFEHLLSTKESGGRLGVSLDAGTGAIDRWLYRDPAHPILPMLDQAGFTRTGREVALRSPLTEEQV